MDLVTQAVLGATIGVAAFGRALGPRAAVGGALLGMAPDADIIAGAFGPWANMVHHRGITHSLIFAPLMCWPLGHVAWRLDRRRGSRRTWTHLAFWALWTHPMLDVFTTYGTQLALPWSDARYSLDGISIIDPLYTTPMMVALLIARRSRDRPQVGKRAAWAALLLTTTYLGLGLAQAQAARQRVSLALERQAHSPVTALRATPTFANIAAWRVFARHEDGALSVTLTSNLAPAAPLRVEVVPKPQTPLVQAAYTDERVERFDWFAQGWLSYHVHDDPQGARLRLIDQRYGGVLEPTRGMWGADVRFDAQGRVQDVTRFNDRPTGRLGAELAALRALILRGSRPEPPSPASSTP